MAASTPLASGTEAASGASATPTRPAAPAFKLSTFLLTFLFVLGLWMLFDGTTRTGVALAIGTPLQYAIGFNGQWVLLTMFLAAAFEMFLTALAYNWTTDWVAQAKVSSWGTALRKVQMAALRSGKKDRIEAIKPFQRQFTELSSRAQISQLKGMAVTWFLLIAVYTWIGIFLAGHPVLAHVNLGGATVNLNDKLGGFLPEWIVIFSLYSIPLNLAFRRLLKHYSLRRLAQRRPSVSGPGATGDAA